MIPNRSPKWPSLLQHGFFVLCIALSAYAAAVRTLTPRGISLRWYHRAGLLGVGLFLAVVVMALPGLLVVAICRAAKGVRERSERGA